MKLIGFIILLFAGTLVSAQNVEFKATAPTVVAVGEEFRLDFTLNRKGTDLQVPTLTGFDLLMGPQTSQSSSFSNFNGQVTQGVTLTYTYLLEAKKEGVYDIPAATIMVEGKRYSSNTLKIQVVKGEGNADANSSSNRRQNPAAPDASGTVNEKNLFVRLDINRKNLYIGEGVVATIKVYTKVDLVNFGRTTFPSFQGFLAEEVPTPQRIELVRETYDGQIYNVGVIRKMLLFPQHTGEITIEPFELECVVRQRLTGSDDFFDDFFGNYRNVKAVRRSTPVTVNVKELPQAGKPLGFSGTVGEVSMATSISANEIKANDAITYKVVFRGTGNLKLMKAPAVNFPHDFEVYDPKESKDIQTGVNGMTGSVTFEYLAIPRYSGDYTIPAIEFSYFDPQTNSYKSITGNSYDIHVQKGAEKSSAETVNAIQSFKKEDVRMVGEDIRYLKTDGLKLHDKGVRFFGTPSYWLALIVPFVLFVIGALLNRRRIQANADLVRVKNRAANKMAKKRMKVAAQAMKSHNGELFYDEVLKAMWGYVSYKLNIDRAELSKDNINDLLQKKSVDGTLIQEFIGVLDACEYARYAPDSRNDQEMDKVYSDGIMVITRLDKAMK